jgi:hypothetical protein
MSAKEELIEKLRKTLPVCWDRKHTGNLTGDLMNPDTLTNLMSLGKGPSGVVKHGRKVIIEKDHFLAWLEPRLEVDREGKEGNQRLNP